MNVWHELSTGEKAPKFLNAIIEIPKGCSTKYELDKETGLLKLDRHLFSAMFYPADYGFVPKTYCDDKDPLDVLIFTRDPTHPMTLCEVKVIGVLHMVDSGEQDDKIIAVHANDPRYKEWNDIKDIPQHLLKELKHFFETYKDLQGKKVEVYKIKGAKEAYKVIEDSVKLYEKTFKN